MPTEVVLCITLCEVKAMPEYDFKCPHCGERFSQRTSIKDRREVRCPKCGQQPEQVFTAVNINKGSSCG